VKAATMLIIVMALVVAGCSSPEQKIAGNWAGLQASQAEGTNEPLSHYNYWEVAGDEITLSSYYIENRTGKKVVYDTSKTTFKYTWKSDNEIIINEQRYTIKIRNNKMTVANDHFEMEFEKMN